MIEQSDVIRATIFGAVKGVVLSGVMAATDIAFYKQLVIAVVAAVIGTAGAILAAVIARKETKANRREIESIKGGLGLTKRAGDQPPPGSKPDAPK